MPLLISLKVAAIATLITVSVAIPVAYGMAKYKGRGQSLIDSLLLLPLVLPPTVIGFALLWLLGDRSPLSPLLDTFQINIVFTWWAAVLTAVIVSFPLMYRSSRAAFEQIDTSLLAVARTLGATEWRIFRRVAIPLAGPGIMAGVLLSFARALGEFGATLMLAGNIPGKTQTLPMAVYFAVERGDLGMATKWSLVIGAIALVVVVFANRLSQLPHKKHTATLSQSIYSKQIAPSQVTTKSPLSLSVDITKQLPNFTLRIQFQTTDVLIGILGASGAGKSLLLRCLAGVETPDSGRIALGHHILYDSEQAINLPSSERQIALLFQNYALFPHLTVSENVAFGIHKLNKHEQSERIWSELAAVQMEPFAHYYPHQLSGGQQQRVALARALASRPELLLLDEPFSALDTHLRSHLAQQIFDRIDQYRGTALLVTHSFPEVYRAKQMVVLDQGQVVRQSAPRDIFERPGRRAIAQLTGPINQSPMQISGDRIYSTHWKMPLQLPPNNLIKQQNSLHDTDNLSVGIRPHHVSFVTESMYNSSPHVPERAVKISSSSFDNIESTPLPETNQAPGWLANVSQLPRSVVLSIKLHSAARHTHDYHLQAIVPLQHWQQLRTHPLPWTVHLPPEHLIVLRP